MKKNLVISLAACLVAVLAPVTGMVFAQTDAGSDNIQYPVAELGGCTDKADCKAYCDLAQNMQACVEFARKNGLMSAQELQEAEKFLALGGKGPGGCENKTACETYCDNTGNMRECMKFAIDNGLLSGQELQEARGALAAIERGVTPPPCKGKKECDVYCEGPSHMEECVNFGIQAGFIQGKELEDAQKMLAAIKKGVTPPKCNGKEECDAYCQTEEHFTECTDFAVAAGFMTAQDAEMARKTGGKGPGGCKNKEECDAFCNNPANQETCFKFGVDNGLIPAEELQKMEEGRQRMKESLAQAPAEVLACLQQLLGSDMVEKMKSGAAMPSQSSGDQMRQCFEKFMPMMSPGQEPGAGGMMPPGQGGPGGCKSEDECKTYCLTNPDECKNFKSGPTIAPEGTVPGSKAAGQYDIMPGTIAGQFIAGPGGCKSEEECKTYCLANPNECMNFTPPGGNAVGGQPSVTNTFAPGTMPGGIAGQIIVGPGGCKTPEECQSYCQANPDACKNFVPPTGGAATPNINQQIMAPPIPMGQPGTTMGIEGQPGTSNTYAPGTAPGTMPGQPQYGTQPGMEINQYSNMQPPVPPAGMEGQLPQQPKTDFTPPPPPSTESGANPPSSLLNSNPLLAALISVFRYFFPF